MSDFQSKISPPLKKPKFTDLNSSPNTVNSETITIPDFSKPENLLDKNMKSPSDSGYDPTTLYIPPEELNKLTPTMKQYWIFKQNNFDKIVFFKMGQFYELFYSDAIIGARYLDLNLNSSRMSIGFREQNIEENANILLNLGYKIAVVDQIETAEEMNIRLKNISSEKKKEKNKKKVKNPNEKNTQNELLELKTLQRSLSKILTRGTFPKTQGIFGSNLLVLKYNGNKMGFANYDSSLNEINIGILNEEDLENRLITLLFQINPDEIVFDSNQLPINIIKILENSKRNICSKVNKWSIGMVLNLLTPILGEDFYKKSKVFPIFVTKLQQDLILETLAALFNYFESLMLIGTIENYLKFKHYDLNNSGHYMRLDANAIVQLELFEWKSFEKNKNTGTFYDFINQTSTVMGARLLKKWVLAPFKNKKLIEDRLNSIEDLIKIEDFRDELIRKLRKLKDVERELINFYSAKDNMRNEEVFPRKFSKFLEILNDLSLIESLISDLQPYSNKFTSQRLRKLVNYEKNNGILPEATNIISESFNSLFDPHPSLYLVPKIGIIEEYDEYQLKIKTIYSNLDDILLKIQKKFNDYTICFSHAKFRFELEIPEHHVKGLKKPEFLEFSSAKAGFQRFLTIEIKEQVKLLESYEQLLKKILIEFSYTLHSKFMKNAIIWDELLQIIAELDCLCVFSVISQNKLFTRPILSHDNSEIKVENLKNPCLLDKFDPLTFEINNNRLMLLTGPNMGGKSTLLKSLALSVILSHMGCYVPANKIVLPEIDSIFTRFGSKEMLSFGKSSFYVELEETKLAIRHCTKNSLVLMDELGIGTSTFDGVAISYAVIKYFSQIKNCFAIFTTHYKQIMQEFEKNEKVHCWKMIVNFIDDHIYFPHIIENGICENSFGFKVAEIAGINKEVIEKANEISNKNNIEALFNKKISFLN